MQKITWKQYLIFGFGIICIVFGILKLTGVVNGDTDGDFFARGNPLENSMRINRSTREDHEQFKTDGGLSKTDMWHGYRVASYEIRYDDQSGKVSGIDVDLKREFVHNMGFTTTVVTIKDLQKMLKPVCSPNGEEWSSMHTGDSDLYAVSLKSYPNARYECGVLDNPEKQTLTVLINLRKSQAPSPADTDKASAPIQPASPGDAQPKPVSLRICKDSNGAWRTFQRQIQAAIHSEPVKNLDQIDGCQEVTVMSNDQGFISRVAGMGDHQFQMEHPVAFEISITDANCEKQCADKASGWVSSYELPMDLWPTGDEWIAARGNEIRLNGYIAGMAAANRVFREINNRQDLSADQRQDLYDRAKESYNAGVKFVNGYGI